MKTTISNSAREPSARLAREANDACRRSTWIETSRVIAQHEPALFHPSEEADDRDRLRREFWLERLAPELPSPNAGRDGDTDSSASQPDRASLQDDNLRAIRDLAEWIEQHGVFHEYHGRVVAIQYESHSLSLGDLLIKGPPVRIWSAAQTCQLLSGLTREVVRLRRIRAYFLTCLVLILISLGVLLVGRLA